MMLTIHGLPSHVKYHDLKVLVKQVCNLNPSDFILDNLNSEEGNTKKVRIGVADERSRAYLIECLDGFRMDGHVLQVVPVGNAVGNPQHNFDHGKNYSLRNEYRPDRPSYNPTEMSSSQFGPLSRPVVMPGRPLPLPGSHIEFKSHHEPIGGPQVLGHSASMLLDPMRSYPPPVDPGLNRAQSGPLNHPSPIVGQAGPMIREPVQGHQAAGQSRGDMWDHGRQWENYSQTRPQQNNYGYQAQQGNTPFGQPNKVPQDKSFLNNRPEYDKPGSDNKYQDSGPEPKRLKIDIPEEYCKGPRFSPRRDVGRRESPADGHRVESSSSRRTGSPLRRDKLPSTYQYGSRATVKDVRPAYEAPTQAPKQTGGYTPNIRDEYKTQENCQEKARMFTGKKDDDRRNSRPKFEREQEPKARSPHGSRSPLRRHPLDRSPPRDRFIKHSMSPRPPRRSWALEKRCSPELTALPPPPMWPRSPQDDEYRFNILDHNRPPVWERPFNNVKSDQERCTDIPEKRRDREIRVRSDLGRTGLLESTHVSARDTSVDDRSNIRFSAKESVFAQRDPKFEPRRDFNYMQKSDSRESRRELNFEPQSEAKYHNFEPRREPKFEPRVEPADLKFEPRVEQRDLTFEPRVEPADLKFQPRVEQRDLTFDPRVEPADLKFQPKVEQRDLTFEPRVEPRDLKFEPRRAPKFEPREQARDTFEPRREPEFEQRVVDRDLKFELGREPKFEMREPKFVPRREPKFEPRRDQAFEKRVTEFDTRLESKYESRREPHFDHQFEPRREPLFESRETKFELRREPVFEPRDPKFELRREPYFKPREPQFEPKNTNLESRRDPKFEPRQPVFEPRADKNEPEFEPGPRFNQRPTRVDARQDTEYRLAERNNIAQRYDIRDPSMNDIKSERLRQSDARRPDTRCEVVDILPLSRKPKSDFNKEFEDVYKRSMEFKQKVEEMRRNGDKRREESGENKPEKKQQRDDERRRDHSRPDDRRQEFRPEDLKRNRGTDIAEMKSKRDKAVEEIAQKILLKHSSKLDLSPSQSQRLTEELKFELVKIFQEMFHNQDFSFIEMVVKFNARFSATSEARLFEDVLNTLPSSFKTKQEMRGDPEIPATTPRMSSHDNMRQVPDWSVKMDPQQLPALMQQFDIVPHVALQEMIGMPSVVPLLPMPINPAMVSLRQPLLHELPVQQQIMQPILQSPVIPLALHNMVENEPQKICDKAIEEEKSGFFNLYLCKDDFEPYSTTQSEYLKKFLVNQIIAASESRSGWTPDFTLKGLSQSVYRYELVARDDNTRDWILKLDFSNFSFFNVLVYTKEELWYERAAIWLPGHSKYRTIEPLQKLKLQNSHLAGVNVVKWKMVKKIETAKGTRLYIDMPPSSARALEKHKMLLSYELQKVSVFLKAVAVDKDTFDSGLKESSVNDENVIKNAINNSPMPSLGPDPNIIKISLKGNKALNVDQARKIKERLIYHIFKYHQDKRYQKTDFVKFGFCLPGSFGVLPENSETRRWLENLDLGKLYKHAIVVLGSGDSTTKFITMNVVLKRSSARDVINHSLYLERLKISNQGVKGLNFHLWKYLRCHINKDHKVNLAIDMDVESVDTLSKLKYKLDYVDEYQYQQTAVVTYVRSYAKLEELVKKYKSELLLTDSYDVANMELESDPDDDDDIIFMGQVQV